MNEDIEITTSKVSFHKDTPYVCSLFT